MKLLYLPLAALCLAACKKDVPAYTVELEAACFRCAVEGTHNGQAWADTIGRDLPPDTSIQPMGRTVRSFTALAGDEVSIAAHSLQEAGKSVLVSAKVDGHVQGFEYVIPTGADSARPASIRFVVPELDRFGSPK